MIKKTFLFVIYVFLYLLGSLTFATSTPTKKVEITEEERPSNRSHSLSTSSSSKHKKGFLSYFSKGKKDTDRKAKNKKSSLYAQTQQLGFTLPNVPILEQPLTSSSMPKGLLNKLQECQDQVEQVQLQARQKAFPPEILSYEQIQAILIAKYRANKINMVNDLNKEREFTDLDEETLASIKTTSERYKGLLAAARTKYIDIMQENEKLAAEEALRYLQSFNQLEEDAAIQIDSRITAKRLMPISPSNHGSTATAVTNEGKKVSSILYSYKIMVEDQELKLPYMDDDKKVSFLSNEIYFNFTKLLS